jgi:hypothetical protein
MFILLFVVRCSLFVVRCSLFVVRCLVFVVRCLLFVVCCSLFGVCCSLFVVCHFDRLSASQCKCLLFVTSTSSLRQAQCIAVQVFGVRFFTQGTTSIVYRQFNGKNTILSAI